MIGHVPNNDNAGNGGNGRKWSLIAASVTDVVDCISKWKLHTGPGGGWRRWHLEQINLKVRAQLEEAKTAWKKEQLRAKEEAARLKKEKAVLVKKERQEAKERAAAAKAAKKRR